MLLSSGVNGGLTLRTASFLLRCASFDLKGYMLDATDLQLILNLKECEEPKREEPCGIEFNDELTNSLLNDTPTTDDEFTTNLLEANLVYLNKAKTELGILFATAIAQEWADFSCGSTRLRLVGEVVGEIGTADIAQSANTIVFAENSGMNAQRYTDVEVTPPMNEPLEIETEAGDGGPPPAPPMAPPLLTESAESIRLTAAIQVIWSSPDVGVEG